MPQLPFQQNSMPVISKVKVNEACEQVLPQGWLCHSVLNPLCHREAQLDFAQHAFL
uniref:Rnf5 n=1 Tax=Rhizophora mucronata TaxID=61149 RepID=A0A2P2JBX8_RHIMU